MNGYVVQQVKYVFYYPQKVFNIPSVLNNVFILTISLSLVYITYFKIGQAFKERSNARIRYWSHIINSLWQVGSYLFMIIICSYDILTHLPSTVDDVSGQETHQASEVIFSLICTVHLHSAFLSFKYNGLNRTSLRWVVATIALCLSYGTKSLKIGVKSVLICSMISLMMEVISLSVNITESLYKRPMGAKLSLSIAVFFSVIWAFFYLYLYPFFVLLPISALNSTNSSVSFISLLLLALWSKYFLDWYSTPFVRFLWMSTTRSHPANWLSCLFFIQKNDVTEKLLLIRKGEREKEQNVINHLSQSEEVKNRQNSQTMMQTIRCVLLLKKKLRRMRERKNLELSDESQKN